MPYCNRGWDWDWDWGCGIEIGGVGLGLGLRYEIWDCDGLTHGTWGWDVGLELGFGIRIGMWDRGLACGIGNEVWDWDWDWGWDAESGYTGTGQTWQRYGNDMG